MFHHTALIFRPSFWSGVAGILLVLAVFVWMLSGEISPWAPWLLAGGVFLSFSSFLSLVLTIGALQDKCGQNLMAADLLEINGDGRALCDMAGNVLFQSEQARQIWDDNSPMAWLESNLHPDVPDGVERLDRLSKALKLGINENQEIALVDCESDDPSDVSWWQIEIAPSHRVEGSILVARDITSRRIIDDLLVREREGLADFLFFLPVGLYSVDVDGQLHYINQTMARWLGDTPDNLIGLSLADLMEGFLPDPDGAWEGEIRFTPLGGATSFDSRVVQATYDDNGNVRTRSVVIRHDVAQSSLQATEETNRREKLWFFDEAPVGIVLLDAQGRILDCNETCQSLLERPRSQLVDCYLVNLVDEDDRALLEDQVARLMGGKARRGRVDVGFDKPEADRVNASLFISRMESRLNARTDGLLVHIIDTSEQKNLEQQVAQAQKMQAMGQLAGGIAHDFNNLLTAMIGFSELLLQRHGAGDPSFADIMQIRQNANRAANLVRQLLAFSRRQPLRPRLLNVTDALAELSHLLRRLLGERISLKLSHGRETCLIRVDPSQFDQVIINLAVNARDAMPNGGQLDISTRVRNLGKEVVQGAESVPAGKYVVIKVSDKGSGISRKDISRIFEPFFTTKAEGTAGAGTGLGLSTVYGIVRQTEGYIFVDSLPGQGATFTICLPLQQPDNKASEDAQEKGDHDTPFSVTTLSSPAVAPTHNAEPLASGSQEDLSGQGTILFVEDEDAVRVFGSRALRNKGYEVLEACSGEGALEVLGADKRIDLLITDMVMPGMDGAALARHVRETRPDLPIILVSGYSEDVIQGDIMSHPGTHFLAKPFSLKDLAAKVRDVLA